LSAIERIAFTSKKRREISGFFFVTSFPLFSLSSLTSGVVVVGSGVVVVG
jgi:hypothetical protein